MPVRLGLRPAGLEPTTYSSGGCRSIQLSYEREKTSSDYNRKIGIFQDRQRAEIVEQALRLL